MKRTRCSIGLLIMFGNRPRATSVQVEPFMPPVFGYKLVGQFDVWSYPSWGSYLFFAYGLLLVGAAWLTWRSLRVTQTEA